MSNARPIARRATTTHLCPVCESASKGCSNTDDGLHFCRGGPDDTSKWSRITKGPDSAGFEHYRRVDDKRHLNENLLLNGKPHNDPKPIIGGKAKGKPKPHPKPNAGKDKPQTWREQVKKFFHDANNKDGRWASSG